jgi:cytochrome oxidase assembly protein ShyY1
VVLKALRQPRYAALSVLMVLVAAICVLAGSWQIARLATKAGANGDLRRNAHAAPSAVASVLPLVGAGRAPSSLKVQFRTVTATGTFDADHASLVRGRTQDGDTGYLVLTPLRTPEGTLLVVRGFISGTNTGEATPVPQAPPTGRVSVTARVEPAETRNDAAASLPAHQVESINPPEQAARLDEQVFNGYAELLAGQPGVGDLAVISSPDLSNPAGGAVEPQHVAYIIQWYLFALLALAAPIAMVRAETRHEQAHDIDEVPEPPPTTDSAWEAERARAAKLADRYGRAVQ